MKLLMENWRKLLEGEVIPFPSASEVSEDDMLMVTTFEGEVSDMLGEIYGNQSEIPLNVIEIFDSFVNAVEESLKR
jgi:hypothetical protein|tara:strand:- start:158 stop:385 length:228 start_codon:yes stop_codon:yes gene_type:complete